MYSMAIIMTLIGLMKFFSTGVSQNHSISMSGGGSKNNYRASYTLYLIVLVLFVITG